MITEYLKIFLTKFIVKPFKAFPYFGRFRFWCLYWAYRLTGWHIRHKEWDFVLEYLPKLGSWQKVNVLDVGCSRNLFAHEVVARGYNLRGIDLEIPCFSYPGKFYKSDIRFNSGYFENYFDLITCISVLEHVEDVLNKPIPSPIELPSGQNMALENMNKFLKIGGRLLLTIPTHEFAQGHPWHGFNYQDIRKLLPDNCTIIEYTERAGQLCLAIERTN